MARISILAMAVVMMATSSVAQQPAFRRTELQRADLSAAGREAVTVIVEVPSGAMSGRHSHPGEEIGYVLEGVVVVEIDGEPPRTYTAGNAFLIAAGRIHNARNTSSAAVRVLATYVVEKGRPLATPAP